MPGPRASLPNPPIRISKAFFTYEGAQRPSLSAVDLEVFAGECVVIAGSSGCGKTTLTRLINALVPHFYGGGLQGKVEILGKDITEIEPHELSAEVGSVFQNPRSQFFNVDTDSEIVFGMENSGIPRLEMQRRFHETVKLLDIEHLLGRSIFELSGGEKQIIACASVYAMQPRILVFDEPSSNLDARAIAQLENFMLTAKAAGVTIVVAEHRLYYLKDLADRVIRMDQGSIVEEWSGCEARRMNSDEMAAHGLRPFTRTELDYRQVPSLRIEERAADTDLLGRGSIEGASFGRSSADRGPKATRNAKAASPSAVLSTEGLAAGYEKGKLVFEGISLGISPGEILGLVGGNGQGKTTFVRTLCGLHREYGGRVSYYGAPLAMKRRRYRTTLVMQDPDYQLFSDSVKDELKLCADPKAAPSDERIEALLRELDLYEYLDRHPLSLSGGQKQRLSIALAALSPADVLIFDEPTSGLDYTNMKRVSSLLRELAKSGKALLVVTHDNEFLECTCDRLVSLGNVCLQEQSSPQYSPCRDEVPLAQNGLLAMES